MDLLVRRLLAQAQLFDDPAAYEAGVRDAIDVLERERSRERSDDGQVDGHDGREGDGLIAV